MHFDERLENAVCRAQGEEKEKREEGEPTTAALGASSAHPHEWNEREPLPLLTMLN